MNEVDAWRRMDTPPPGGLARLQAAIEARGQPAPASSRSRPWVAASIAAIVVAFAATTGYREHLARRAFDDSLQLALAGMRTDAIRRSGIERELPSSRADVRILVLTRRDPPTP